MSPDEIRIIIGITLLVIVAAIICVVIVTACLIHKMRQNGPVARQGRKN